MPASSTSSERYFSIGALTITKLRNRLTKDTFNSIMCLKSWGILEEDKEETKEASKAKEISEEALFVYN